MHKRKKIIEVYNDIPRVNRSLNCAVRCHYKTLKALYTVIVYGELIKGTNELNGFREVADFWSHA